jgi:hypothetical protein
MKKRSRRKFLLNAASLIAMPAIIRTTAEAKAWSHGGDLAWDHGFDPSGIQSVNLVFLGDSEFVTHSGASIPDTLSAALAGVAHINEVNIGRSGITCFQQMTAFDTEAGAAYNPNISRNICILHCGSNDTTSVSFAQWQVCAQGLVDSLVGRGYQVIVTEAYQWLFNAFPGSLFNTASDWAQYNTIQNALLRTTAIIKISQIPQLTNQANVGNAPYYVDTEHLAQAGVTLWSNFAEPTVAAVINSIPATPAASPIGALSPTGAWSSVSPIINGWTGGFLKSSNVDLVDWLYDQSGNARDFKSLSPNTLTTPSIGVGPITGMLAHFDRTLQNGMTTAATISNFFSASSGCIAVLMQISVAGPNGTNYYDNDVIISDGNNTSANPSNSLHLGMFSKVGPLVLGANFDGASKVVQQSLALSTWAVMQWKITGGTLQLRVDKGSWQSIATGNTTNIGLNLMLGAGTASFTNFGGDVGAVLTFSTPPSDANLNAVVDYLKLLV